MLDRKYNNNPHVMQERTRSPGFLTAVIKDEQLSSAGPVARFLENKILRRSSDLSYCLWIWQPGNVRPLVRFFYSYYVELVAVSCV